MFDIGGVGGTNCVFVGGAIIGGTNCVSVGGVVVGGIDCVSVGGIDYVFVDGIDYVFIGGVVVNGTDCGGDTNSICCQTRQECLLCPTPLHTIHLL